MGASEHFLQANAPLPHPSHDSALALKAERC
jgi:hypothetical protein